MSTRLDRSTRTLTTEPRRGAQELRRAQGWGGHERRRAVSEPGLPPRARARGGTAKAFRPRALRSSCPPLLPRQRDDGRRRLGGGLGRDDAGGLEQAPSLL